jgi:hypothetical protein
LYYALSSISSRRRWLIALLTSASGTIRWHHDGWLPMSQLVADLQAATAG